MEESIIKSIFILSSLLFLCWVLFSFIEHGYSLLFKKPLYVHFYVKLYKLPVNLLTQLQLKSSYYNRLHSRDQKYFEHRVFCFLRKYTFKSRNEAIIDDELKILVASAYVMITFGMRRYLTKAFKTILIHPDSYFSAEESQLHNGEFNPKYKAVVFSRKALLQGFENDSDNLNLAIHEFAHVLTYSTMKARDVSASIFSDQYQKIIKNSKQFDTAEELRNSSYFRIYAFTNQYEFIAVILEHYFESPELFEKNFPVLYKDVGLMINQRSWMCSIFSANTNSSSIVSYCKKLQFLVSCNRFY